MERPWKAGKKHWEFENENWGFVATALCRNRYLKESGKSQAAEVIEWAGWMPETSCLRLRARARKSHSTWMPCQKVSDWPKNAPNRMDIERASPD